MSQFPILDNTFISPSRGNSFSPSKNGNKCCQLLDYCIECVIEITIMNLKNIVQLRIMFMYLNSYNSRENSQIAAILILDGGWKSGTSNVNSK